MDNESAYRDFRHHLTDSLRKSYEQFDKAIFLLSFGGLGASLTILNTLIEFKSANFKWLLFCTWIFFALPLISTLFSYVVSQKAIQLQIGMAYAYYLNDDNDPLSKGNIYSTITNWLNKLSAILVTIGILSLIAFVYINISAPEVTK